MRERAGVATPGPWESRSDEGYGDNFIANWRGPYLQGVGSTGCGSQADIDAAHIVSWSPDVARRVADLLEWAARDYRGHVTPLTGDCCCACAIAREYLGEA